MSKKILDDHQRKGKILTPPLLSIGTFIETAWIDYAVPEFVWILLLIEKYGARDGSLLSLRYLSILDHYLTSKTKNGAATSILSFSCLLSELERKEILAEMDKALILEKFKKAFLPFIELYPECPINFINTEKNIQLQNREQYIMQYKKSLDDFLDKTSIKSSLVMANVIGFLTSVNRFHITKDSKTPQLDEIFNYPETEESKHLASFLRSSISMCFNVEWGYNRSNNWINYFWNQSLKIQPSRI